MNNCGQVVAADTGRRGALITWDLQKLAPAPAAVCRRLLGGLNSAMVKPAHTFKIGQQVYHHPVDLSSGTRSGPYTVIGLLWQSEGAVRYCIKSTTREQIVDESDLQLALSREDTGE